MILFLFLVQIIFSNEFILFYEQENGVGIEKFEFSESNIAMSYGRASSSSPIPSICISYDYGRNFQILNLFDRLANNRTLREIEYHNNKFIIHQQYGHLYRYTDKGDFIDSIKLDTDYSHSIKSVKNNKYLVNFYKKANYDENYHIFITENSYESYIKLELNLNKDSLTNRFISDIDIFNDNLYLAHQQYYYKYVNSDSSIFCISSVIRYNIKNNKLDTFKIKDDDFNNFNLNKIKVFDEDKFMLINTVTEQDQNSYIDKNSLYIYESNKLNFIDSIKGPRREFITFHESDKNDFFITNRLNYIYKVNVLNKNSERLGIDFTDNIEDLEYTENVIHTIKKNELTNTYFSNLGMLLMIELDLEYLFSINNIKEIGQESKIYPNPNFFGEDINMEFTEDVKNICIYDLMGRKYLQIEGNGKNYKIGSSNFSKGIFIVIVDFYSHKELSKIIIK